jgi:hypothetical protein
MQAASRTTEHHTSDQWHGAASRTKEHNYNAGGKPHDGTQHERAMALTVLSYLLAQ